MSNANYLKAKEIYNSLCAALEANNWHFRKVEEDMVVVATIKGDDFPVDFVIKVNPEIEKFTFISYLPTKVPEDKRVDFALAVCQANYGLTQGRFDYDISDGTISYENYTSFKFNEINPEHYEYLIMISAGIIDKYNDKFFMLEKGVITIKQFIEQDQQ